MNKNANTAHLARFVPADPWFGWERTGKEHICTTETKTLSVAPGPWEGTTIFQTTCVCGALTRIVDKG
jgi:hypothetical protein